MGGRTFTPTNAVITAGATINGSIANTSITSTSYPPFVLYPNRSNQSFTYTHANLYNTTNHPRHPITMATIPRSSTATTSSSSLITDASGSNSTNLSGSNSNGSRRTINSPRNVIVEESIPEHLETFGCPGTNIDYNGMKIKTPTKTKRGTKNDQFL